MTRNFTLPLASLALGFGFALVLLADTARAAVCIVPPHPRGGTQAKAATGLIDINENRSFNIPGFQTVSDPGSGYISAPDAFARSVLGIGVSNTQLNSNRVHSGSHAKLENLNPNPNLIFNHK